MQKAQPADRTTLHMSSVQSETLDKLYKSHVFLNQLNVARGLRPHKIFMWPFGLAINIYRTEVQYSVTLKLLWHLNTMTLYLGRPTFS